MTPFRPDPKPIKKAKKDLHNFATAMTKLAKRKPIKKVSAKRKGKLKAYTPLRKQYLLDHPNCEIKLIGCTGKATQIHHCSTSDLNFLNTKTWKACDDWCHNIVERVLSAADRRDKGLLI